MPFQSQAQQRYMFANMPKMAKRWAKHTPNIKGLPKKLHPKKHAIKNLMKKYGKQCVLKPRNDSKTTIGVLNPINEF